jgi:hypothetical protein
MKTLILGSWLKIAEINLSIHTNQFSGRKFDYWESIS